MNAAMQRRSDIWCVVINSRTIMNVEDVLNKRELIIEFTQKCRNGKFLRFPSIMSWPTLLNLLNCLLIQNFTSSEQSFNLSFKFIHIKVFFIFARLKNLFNCSQWCYMKFFSKNWMAFSISSDVHYWNQNFHDSLQSLFKLLTNFP